MSEALKIVATVGASIFTNFNSPEVQHTLQSHYGDDFSIGPALALMLRGGTVTTSEIETIRERIMRYFLWNMELVLETGIKAGRQWRYQEKPAAINRRASAEIQSTLEIMDEPEYRDQAIQLYLLCTDTFVSKMAGNLIKEALEKEALRLERPFTAEVKVVPGLQILDKKEFGDRGFDGLFAAIMEIQEATPRTAAICLNVTGGYKSILPILTVIAQLFKYPLYYVFEFAGAGNRREVLLEIPPLPIQFDWGQIDWWEMYLAQRNLERSELSAVEQQVFEEQLVPYRLFSRQNDETYRRTTLGTIFHNYIQRNTPHGKSVLGFLVENKFFDYYHQEYIRECRVEHSADLDGVEIDILLTREHPKEYTWVEVKSFNQICNAYNKSRSSRSNFASKLGHYLRTLRPETLDQILSFHLCIYRQRFQDLSNRYFQKNVGKLRRRLEKAGISEFKVFLVDLDLSRDPSLPASGNPYTQRLMNRRFTSDPAELSATGENTRYLLVYDYEKAKSAYE